MSPFKPASSLTPDDVSVLYDAIRSMLGDAVERSRGLAASELKGEKKSHLAVHGRTGQKCPVCGDVVREVSFADSSLQYCATCQTGGKPLADRRLEQVAEVSSVIPMDVPTMTLDDLPGELPDSMVVLDVREQSEWVHGHIDGAHHIPLSELGGRLADVPDDKLLVVCKIGGRSAQAVAWLGAHGHDAYNLAGGMIEWAETGRPMVSETGSAPHVV